MVTWAQNPEHDKGVFDTGKMAMQQVPSDVPLNSKQTEVRLKTHSARVCATVDTARDGGNAAGFSA